MEYVSMFWEMKNGRKFIWIIAAILAIGIWGGQGDPFAGVASKKDATKALAEARQAEELGQYKSIEVKVLPNDGWFQLYERAGIVEGTYKNEVLEKDFVRRNGGRMPRLWASDKVNVPAINKLAQK